MNGLIEGRIVHYVMPSDLHRPSIIVNVINPLGRVNLTVFVDGTNDVKGEDIRDYIGEGGENPTLLLWETEVRYSDAKEVGTWHWIEKS